MIILIIVSVILVGVLLLLYLALREDPVLDRLEYEVERKRLILSEKALDIQINNTESFVQQQFLEEVPQLEEVADPGDIEEPTMGFAKHRETNKTSEDD